MDTHCPSPGRWSDEQGRPYFAMELVRGVPITDYANQAKLETDARLALFLQVCGAASPLTDE